MYYEFTNPRAKRKYDLQKILLNIMIMRVKKCEKVTPDYMHRKNHKYVHMHLASTLFVFYHFNSKNTAENFGKVS